MTLQRIRRVHAADPALVYTIVALLFMAVYSHHFGNTIATNSGLGWDGRIYGDYAQTFLHRLTTQGFESWYYAARMLPSGLVWALLPIIGKPRSLSNVITGFEILNVVLLVSSSVIWSATGRALALSRRAIAIGHVAGMVSFAVLKMTFFYPVLTDTAAYACGYLLVYAYVTNRLGLLLVGWLAGGFVFPPLVLMGLLLVALPRSAGQSAPPGRSMPNRTLTAALLGGYTLVGFAVARSDWSFNNWPASTPAERVLLVTGSALAMGYVALAMTPLLRAAHLPSPGRLLRMIPLRRLSVALVGGVLMITAYGYLAANGGTESPQSFGGYVARWFANSNSNLWGTPLPLVFVAAHLAYFGPALALLVVWWRRVVRALARLGIGAIALAIVAVLQSLNSESRQLIAFYPLFVLLLAMSSEDSRQAGMRRWQLLVLGSVALVASRIWLWIPPDLGEPFSDPGMQRYFMNHGPWMARGSYPMQMGLAAVMLLGTWLVAKAPSLPPSARNWAPERSHPLGSTDKADVGHSA